MGDRWSGVVSTSTFSAVVKIFSLWSHVTGVGLVAGFNGQGYGWNFGVEWCVWTGTQRTPLNPPSHCYFPFNLSTDPASGPSPQKWVALRIQSSVGSPRGSEAMEGTGLGQVMKHSLVNKGQQSQHPRLSVSHGHSVELIASLKCFRLFWHASMQHEASENPCEHHHVTCCYYCYH